MPRPKPQPPLLPAPEPGAESPAPPVVRVQKRTGPPEPGARREKRCSVCGQLFQLTADEKFFMCPACYQKELMRKKATRRRGTQVLIQIQCPDCGATDYVEFIPQDPGTTFCRACYERRRREPTGGPDHT